MLFVTQVALQHGTTMQLFYEEEIMRCFTTEECYGGMVLLCMYVHTRARALLFKKWAWRHRGRVHVCGHKYMKEHIVVSLFLVCSVCFDTASPSTRLPRSQGLKLHLARAKCVTLPFFTRYGSPERRGGGLKHK